MRNRIFCSIVLWLLGAGWAGAQSAGTTGLPTSAAGPEYLPVSMEQPRETLATIVPARVDREPPACPGCRLPWGFCCDCGANWWVGADYLLWSFKDAHTPPLVTAGTADSVGILGRPGTTVLFGGSNIDLQEHQGVRITAGALFDDDGVIGVEGNYFFFPLRNVSFVAVSSGAPVLARPFYNVNLNAEDSELVAFPGRVTGAVRVSLDSQLWGAEANLVGVVCDDCCRTVSVFGGFRYAQLDEGLGVTENLTLLPVPGLFGGSQINLADCFVTHNHFYGGQLGARAEWWRQLLFIRLEGKVAIGLSHEVVNINGSTEITPAGGATTTHAGGLLALPSNIGHHHHDAFAVLPEVGLKLGYQLTDSLAVSVGYSFLYWSDVARPGDQIDRVLNPSQLPTTSGPGTLIGPARPAFILKGTDFWAHGVNVGLELRY